MFVRATFARRVLHIRLVGPASLGGPAMFLICSHRIRSQYLDIFYATPCHACPFHPTVLTRTGPLAPSFMWALFPQQQPFSSETHMSANTLSTLSRYMKIDEVKAVTTLGSSTIYRRIKAGTFPPARELGPNCVAWRETDIQEWMDSRPSAHAQQA